MVFIIQDKPNKTSQHNSPKIGILASAKIAYLNPQTIRAGLYGSLMNMAVAVFGAVMGSLYLMQRLQVGKEDAAMVNSMLFLGAIIGGPFVGWCSDRLGLRIAPMKFGAIASLLTVLCILYFLLGFFTATQVISYALVAESCSVTITATAVSIVSILTQSGYIIYQNVFSALLLKHGEMQMIDHVPVYSLGDYQFAAIILPIGLILAILVLFGLKETHCRRIQG